MASSTIKKRTEFKVIFSILEAFIRKQKTTKSKRFIAVSESNKLNFRLNTTFEININALF